MTPKQAEIAGAMRHNWPLMRAQVPAGAVEVFDKLAEIAQMIADDMTEGPENRGRISRLLDEAIAAAKRRVAKP